MPVLLNIDSLLPNYQKDSLIDSTYIDFDPMALDSGRLVTIYKDTIKIHPGILISEKKAAELTFYKSNYDYQKSKAAITSKLLKDYYNKSTDAENVYQAEIKRLQKDAQRSWLEKNIVYFGVVAGIALTILTEFAVINVGGK